MTKLNVRFYLVNLRVFVWNEILKRGSSVHGTGLLLGIVGGGMPPGSLNPDPTSDQNVPFAIRLIVLVVPLAIENHTWFQTIMVKVYIRFQNGSKSILFGAVHTYIADIGEYPPWDLSICRKFSEGIKFLWGWALKDDCCYHRLMNPLGTQTNKLLHVKRSFKSVYSSPLWLQTQWKKLKEDVCFYSLKSLPATRKGIKRRKRGFPSYDVNIIAPLYRHLILHSCAFQNSYAMWLLNFTRANVFSVTKFQCQQNNDCQRNNDFSCIIKAWRGQPEFLL